MNSFIFFLYIVKKFAFYIANVTIELNNGKAQHKVL